jgi:hypothetical protein
MASRAILDAYWRVNPLSSAKREMVRHFRANRAAAHGGFTSATVNAT